MTTGIHRPDGPKLDWPPSEQDLQRLYLDQQLSTRKIALLYGLQSHLTILRLLNGKGIPVRTRAEILEKSAAHLLDGRTGRYEDENEMRRLYLEEGLTCLQIAKRYGLTGHKDAIKKVVSRRLKRMGVEIRLKGEPGKFNGLAAEWGKRYQAGESTVKIARGVTYPSVVFDYLDRLGIKHRDNSQNSTKYRKTPFDGSERDRAYLLGFTRGDLNVRRDHALLKFATSSNHSAMLDLVTSLFCPY